MGFDDMLALIMISEANRKIAGISLVFGNTPIEQVRTNAAAVAQLFGWSFPIHTGAQKSISGQIITAQNVLGADGMPSLGRKLPKADKALPHSPAFMAMVEWLQNIDEKAELLALGPLTNIAILALARPDLLAKIDRIVWMGGSAGRGNHTQFAEFNAYADPEALKIVLDSDVPFYMVDLEACRKVLVSPQDLSVFGEIQTEKTQILHDLLGGYIDIAISRGRPAMALYDPLAAAAMVAPQTVGFVPAFIEVELVAQVRGRTNVSVNARQKQFRCIAMDIEADSVRNLALNSMAEAAR
jgi:inosine-uridine nucleoside N-ribohydrolase